MSLPDNIPPLHSTWEYESAVRTLKALWAEAVSATYEGDNSKERNELELRVDDWVQRNNLVPEGRGIVELK